MLRESEALLNITHRSAIIADESRTDVQGGAHPPQMTQPSAHLEKLVRRLNKLPKGHRYLLTVDLVNGEAKFTVLDLGKIEN